MRNSLLSCSTGRRDLLPRKTQDAILERGVEAVAIDLDPRAVHLSSLDAVEECRTPGTRALMTVNF
jgi:hypothetical protein